MAAIDDPKHPYYLQADPIVEDVNKVVPDLALLGDSLQPIPTLKKMGPNDLEDLNRRSEDMSTQDKILVQHMQDQLRRAGQNVPVQRENTMRSWTINAPWKK